MSAAPIICFGQQPCGFFPKRFLYSKIRTALRLRSEIGGEVVFFCHDSDHDPRETKTILRPLAGGEPVGFNFQWENKLQNKFSPLYLKRIPPDWQVKMRDRLRGYVDPALLDVFAQATGSNAADFCLDMYRRLGHLEGVHVMRSSDPEFRRKACAIDDFFVDVPYEGEIVRARHAKGALRLHKGGEEYVMIPDVPCTAAEISPSRDARLRWMQSVIRCTHYVAGASEVKYLQTEDEPDITYVERDFIERAEEAYVDFGT
jgi:hypothetical protein